MRNKRHRRKTFYNRDLKASAAYKGPQNIDLDTKLEILAAEGSQSEGNFLLMAYTGKPVQVGGFEHPVIVDMLGVTFDKKVTPVLADHDVARRIGHTIEQAIVPPGMKMKVGGRVVSGPLIGAVAVRSSDMEIAKGFVADAKRGFPFQVSIGARIKKGYLLEEGETAEINGKEWSGPLVVAQKSTIRELSVTVLGADNDTTAIVTAKQAKENGMDFEAWVASLGLTLADLSDETKTKLQAEHKKLQAKAKSPTKAKKAPVKTADPDDDDDDDDDESPRNRRFNAKQDQDLDALNVRLAENTERIEAINEVAANFSESGLTEVEIEGKKMKLSAFKSKAIKDKWSAEKFELELRRAERPSLDVPAVHMVNKDISAKAIEASILRSCGLEASATNPVTGRKYGLDQFYDTKTLEASHAKQHDIGASINKLFMLQIQAAGKHVTSFDVNELRASAHRAWSDIKASGTSNISVTNILENVMHKAAYAGFEAVEAQWRQICGRRPLNDFRPHAQYRLDYNGHFRKVGVDGELKHISMTDTKKTIQADTYGAMISVDRRTQIDDDLGMVVQKGRGFGVLGGQRVDELVFTTLLSNPSSFFAAGNGNLLTGASSVLGISALNLARRKFRDQIINGKPISVSPSILLVGTGLELKANQIFTEERMAYAPTTADFGNNPFVGLYRPVVSGYLNNSNITDQDGLGISGQSNTQWYLFANPNAPQGAAIVIGFLNGRETPFFEESETQFNVPGGIQMRAYYDFGVAMHITQMALKANGA